MLPEIVLIGYYGRGNFGDDVLMVVTHALAHQMLPGARIAVRVGTPAAYINRLLGQDVERLPFGTRDEHRILLHGGGGNFFDFDDHNLLGRLLNALLFAGGARSFARLDAMLRKLSVRPRLSARTRIGLGLGIGTYTSGSSRLRESIPVLADFDALWLRDAESIINLARLGVSPHVARGSDLAFLWEHWCPSSLALSPIPTCPVRPRVGVILRDWPAGSGAAFAQSILPLLEHLALRFELTLISLDPTTDVGTLTALPHLSQIKWMPDRMGIPEFAERLAAQDVLLTSRAHGAICGACVGRASVILDIEPKLKAVHAMLPGATRLVSSIYDHESVAKLLDEALSITAECIAVDVLRNREESQRALVDVMQRVNL